MPAPAPKSVIVISATAHTVTGATASGYVDCKGFDYAVLDVCATTTNDTTNNFSVITLSEGDTTSSYAAVSTGDTDWTIATQSTASSAIVAQFRCDLRARKRYLKLSTTGLCATQTVWAHALLQRGDSMPVSAAQAGVDAVINL
jgi:hypothetical protein